MYYVYGNETGELGTFKTKTEALNAIRKADEFDMRELGYTDSYEIIEE